MGGNDKSDIRFVVVQRTLCGKQLSLRQKMYLAYWNIVTPTRALTATIDDLSENWLTDLRSSRWRSETDWRICNAVGSFTAAISLLQLLEIPVTVFNKGQSALKLI